MPSGLRHRAALAALCAIVLLLAVAPAAARTAVPQATIDRADFAHSTDQLIVRMRDDGMFSPARAQAVQPDAITSRLTSRGGTTLQYHRAGSEPNSHILRLPTDLPVSEVAALAARLAADPEVAYAAPDRRAFVDRIPNDPRYASQLWHLQPVNVAAAPGSPVNYGANLPAAWDVTTGSPGIVTAIIDTGGLLNHEDLRGRTPDGNPGYDMISRPSISNDGDGRDGDPSDPGDWTASGQCGPAFDSSWHGSHVAGTIGASGNNGLGITGITWGGKLLHLRALGTCGGYNSDIADAIKWAAGVAVAGVPPNPNPARVINMSLGGFGTCSEDLYLQPAIDAATARGTVIVVAAGNESLNLNTEGDDVDISPAECNGVITVASTARDGYRAAYSNYGSTVEIAAPGGDMGYDSGVVSTVNTGTTVPVADSYAAYEGTSMAAPHVAGTVSLMLSVNPGLSNAEVLQILQETATPFPTGSSCNASICGAGILNAGRAVEEAARRVRTVGWQSVSQVVSEGAGLVKIRAQLSVPSSQSINVPFTVGGTANSDDFTLVAGTLNFPVGSSSATLSFPLIDDTVPEGAEEILVTLGLPPGSPAPAAVSGPATHVVTILDNEVGSPLPTISLGDAEAAGADQVALRFTVQRASAPGAVGVSYVVRPAGGGGTRPILAEGEVSLGASENSKLVTVTFSRAALGPLNSLELALEAPTGGAVLGTPASAQLELVPLTYLHMPIIAR